VYVLACLSMCARPIIGVYPRDGVSVRLPSLVCRGSLTCFKYRKCPSCKHPSRAWRPDMSENGLAASGPGPEDHARDQTTSPVVKSQQAGLDGSQSTSRGGSDHAGGGGTGGRERIQYSRRTPPRRTPPPTSVSTLWQLPSDIQPVSQGIVWSALMPDPVFPARFRTAYL
jgi:hypothetical protein